MAGVRLRHAVGLVGVVALLQVGMVGARASRDPAPFRSFHDFDVTLARTVRVMRGEAWALDLPVVDLVPPTWYGYGPAHMWAAVPSNGAEGQKNYKKKQPLHFLLSGLVPAAVGLGPVSMRMGPWAVLWALVGVLAGAGHYLGGARGLRAAAILGLLVPATWLTAMMSLPALSMMLGVAVVLGLVLVSDRMRRIGLAAGVGGAVAVATWMGESAGDAVQVLAAALPPVVVGGLWGVVARGRWTDRLRAGVGTALALGVAWVLVDVDWIQRHTQGYILTEASAGGRPPAMADFLSKAPVIFIDHFVGGYLETLVQSLLTPAGGLVVAAGVLAGLGSRRRGAVVWALSGPVSLLAMLSVPEKTGDYYALAAIPGLVLAASVGLASLRRLGSATLATGGLGLAVVCTTVLHLDTPIGQRSICTEVGGIVLLQDSFACSSVKPQTRIRPSLRIARQLPVSADTRRMAITQWLHGLDMHDWWTDLPADSTIWVLGGRQTPVDTAEVVALTLRHDVMVRALPTDRFVWRARPVLTRGEQWVFLLSEGRSGSPVPIQWPGWLGTVEDFAGTGDVRVGRLVAP